MNKMLEVCKEDLHSPKLSYKFCRNCGSTVSSYFCNSSVIDYLKETYDISVDDDDWWIVCDNGDCNNVSGEELYQLDPRWVCNERPTLIDWDKPIELVTKDFDDSCKLVESVHQAKYVSIIKNKKYPGEIHLIYTRYFDDNIIQCMSEVFADGYINTFEYVRNIFHGGVIENDYRVH